MKALVIISVLFVAGMAAAQSPDNERSLESSTPRGLRERPQIFHPESRYEIQGTHFTYSGLAVAIAKSPNPVEMFNPLDEDNFDGSANNTVWNEKTGRPLGWRILTIKF